MYLIIILKHDTFNMTGQYYKKGHIQMEMKIETIPAYKIAYIRHIGPYGIENIQTMESLKSWAKLNHLLDDESVILGIAQDNPETTQPENCRYDACLVISGDDFAHDDNVSYGTVAGGKYAVFTVKHTKKAMQEAWMDIFSELHRRGCQIDATRPIIERYAVEMVNNHKCEICIPVC